MSEHINLLDKCEVKAIQVRTIEDLQHVNGLIIPGGESTTIGSLMTQVGLLKEIKRRHAEGMPIYGTCAGAILLAKTIIGSKQPKLGLMDIAIKRNEYGRQLDSFEADLDIFEGDPFKGIFIRAPVVESLYDGCKTLSSFKGKPVLVEQNNLLISTFHPELTDDTRIHEHFIGMVDKARTINFSIKQNS